MALICDQECFSYAQLNQRVERLCATLYGLGVTPAMSIACAAHSRLLNLLLLHALPRLGCTFMPLNPALPDAGLRRFLELGDVDMLVAAKPVAEDIPLLDPQQLLATDGYPEIRHDLWRPLRGHQLHWLLATSGTSGEAKLVALTGNQLSSSVQASAERLELTGSDSWLLCLPLYHVGGLMIPLRCAAAGAALVLHERFDPQHLWDDLHRYNITHLSLVPAMLARLLEHYAGQPPPARLRVMLTGGGALAPSLAMAALDAAWPLCPSYGMTEAASQVATLYPPPTEYAAGLVGKPLSHLQVKIEPISGRIMIRGGSVMQAYAGETRPEGRWFVSGDLGELDEQGNLIVLGRADEVLVSGGENVHPQQVESVLMECPGVEDVAVIGTTDPVWGDRLVALHSGELSSGGLQAWSRAHLPGFMRPKKFVQLDTLPRTQMGKLQRKELAELWG